VPYKAPVPVATRPVICGSKSTGDVILSAAGSSSPFTYQLVTCGANPTVIKDFGTTDSTSIVVKDLVVGTYCFNVIDACGVSGGTSTQVSKMEVNLGPDLSVKFGETATLDAGSGQGYKYQWSTGATTQTINVSVAGTYSVTVSNLDFCSVIGQVKVKFLVGSKDSDDNDNIVLLPNPTQDFMAIRVGNAATTRAYIVNVLGQIILEDNEYIQENQARKIDVSHFSKGVYYIVLEGENYKRTKVFTKY
jgi:hypothetical protein